MESQIISAHSAILSRHGRAAPMDGVLTAGWQIF
jgi:hypothetical protein